MQFRTKFGNKISDGTLKKHALYLDIYNRIVKKNAHFKMFGGHRSENKFLRCKFKV